MIPNLQLVSNSLVGGNVIAMIGRGVMRVNAARQAATFAAGVKRTQLQQNQLSQQGRTTAAQQAAAFEALRSQLRSGSVTPESRQNPDISLFTVPISTREQETYTYRADVTQHAVEQGSIYSDHVIIQPVRIDLSFGISNIDGTAGAFDRARYALELLDGIFRSRSPIELLTEHKRLPDMVMVSLQADNSVPEWGALRCRASFQQIRVATLEVAPYPDEQVLFPEARPDLPQPGGPDVSQSARGAKDQGKARMGPVQTAVEWLRSRF